MANDFRSEWWWRHAPFNQKSWPEKEYFKGFEQQLAFIYELARRIDQAPPRDLKLPAYARSLPAGPRLAPLPRDKFPPWVQLPREVRLKIWAYTSADPFWSKNGSRPRTWSVEIRDIGQKAVRVRESRAETGQCWSKWVELRVNLLANDQTLSGKLLSWIAGQRKMQGVSKPSRNKGAQDRKQKWGYIEALDTRVSGNSTNSSARSKAHRWPVNHSVYLTMRWIVEDWKKEQALLNEPIDLTIPFPFNKKFRASKRGNSVSRGKRRKPAQARGKRSDPG